MTVPASRTAEQWFSEVFPIRLEGLPPLLAYRPVLTDQAERLIDRRTGARLAARLRSRLGGYWFWHGGRLIADSEPDPARLILALDAVRTDAPEPFAAIAALEIDLSWTPDAQVTADYALRWPLAAIEAQLQSALAGTTFALKDTLIERGYQARAWVIDGQPALSLTVTSRLLFEPPLEQFLTLLDKPADLVGHRVADKTAPRSGEITRVLGTVKDHRRKLLAAADAAMRPIIEAAPDDHLVLRVLVDEAEIDVVSDALWLVIRVEEIARFGLSADQAAMALHLNPRLRAEIIRILSDVLKSAGLIGSAFSTANAPALFVDSAPTPALIFGGSKARDYDPTRTPADVERFGPYRTATRSGPLTISVLNAHPDADIVDDFLEAMRRQAARAFQLEIGIGRERKVRVPTPTNLESGVRALGKDDSALMLVFVPDEAASEESGFSEDAVSGRFIKAQTIGRRHPCLIVSESIMNLPEAMLSVILGIMSRAGDTPYALENPLPFADRVAGLHIARLRRRDRDVLVAMSRLYRSDGALLRWYAGRQSVAPGGPLPDQLLADVLPGALLAGKRVVLHHDGTLRRDALLALGGWEDEIGASIMPVAVSQRDVPRLYALRSGKVEAPPWGATMRLNAHEALLNTAAGPLRGDATPQPLHVMAEAPLSIDQALHSVIAMTLFHFGALHRPRLPVTLHQADLIGAAWERGVFFDEDSDGVVEGSAPFWL